MNLLSFAKELEQVAIAFYDECAQSTKTKEFSGIFAALAREERKHYEIFEKWEKKERLPDLEQVVPQVTEILKLFDGLSEQFHVSSGEFFSRSQIFGMAVELEKKSIDHYRKILESTDRELAVHHTLIELIIAQEEGHIEVINALAEFLRHPGEWLENAEFNHQEEF